MDWTCKLCAENNEQTWKAGERENARTKQALTFDVTGNLMHFLTLSRMRASLARAFYSIALICSELMRLAEILSPASQSVIYSETLF